MLDFWSLGCWFESTRGHVSSWSSPHCPHQPRWLSGLRRSRVHSLMIARRSLCPEKLGSNPGHGSKGINFSGWHASRYVRYCDKETLNSNKPTNQPDCPLCLLVPSWPSLAWTMCTKAWNNFISLFFILRLLQWLNDSEWSVGCLQICYLYKLWPCTFPVVEMKLLFAGFPGHNYFISDKHTVCTCVSLD